jgi:hypothetical protein
MEVTEDGKLLVLFHGRKMELGSKEETELSLSQLVGSRWYSQFSVSAAVVHLGFPVCHSFERRRTQTRIKKR